MSHRLLRWWIVLPVALLGLALAALFGGLHWLLATPGGAQWALARAMDVRPGLVGADSVSGTLRGGLTVTGLVIQGDSYRVSVDRVQARATPGVMPWSITVEALRGQGVDVEIRSSEGEGGWHAREWLDVLPLPLAIDVRDARIEEISIHRDGATWLEVATAEVAGRWSDRVSGLEVRLDGQGWAGALSGEIDFTAPWRHDLGGSISWAEATGSPGDVTFRVTGDGDDATLRLSGPEPGMTVEGHVRDWLDEPLFSLAIVGGELGWAQGGAGLALSSLKGSLSGPVEDYEWQGEAILTWSDGDTEPVSVTGRGDLQHIEIRSLQVGPGALVANGNGQLTWNPDPTLSLAIDIDRWLPHQWIAGWPGEHPLTGRLSLGWTPGILTVPELELSPAQSGARLAGSGTVNLSEGVLLADLSWTDLTWPLSEAAPRVSSSRGLARLTGAPDNWELLGDFTLSSGDYPEAQLQARVAGDRDQARWEVARGEFAGGTVAGTGLLDWRDRFTWQSDLVLAGVDSAVVWPEWPARVSAGLHLEPDASGTGVSVAIREGRIIVQGRLVRAEGGLQFSDDGFRFLDFGLQEASSRVSLDGGWNERELLAFALDIRSPGLLAERLGVELSGQGRFGVRPSGPVFEGSVSGHSGRWGDWSVERFTLQGGTEDASPRLTARLENLANGAFKVQVHGTLAGPWRDQVLSLGMDFDEALPLGSLTARAHGAWSQWQDPTRLSWSGELQNLDLRRDEALLLSLDHAAAITLGSRTLELAHACFSAPAGGRLCGQGGLRDGTLLQVNGELADWPLVRLLSPVTPGVDYTQRLGGHFDWSHRTGQRPTAHADLVLSPGTFGPDNDEEARVLTSAGRFGFSMDDGQLHSGRLDIAFEKPDSGNLGRAEIDWGIENVILDGSGRLNGRARITSLDLGVLNSLWPQVDRIGGRFDADFALGGRVSDPNFAGRFTLKGARFDWATLGVALTEMDLDGSVAASDLVSFNGPFRMGEGTGRITGQLDFAELSDPVWSLQLNGENLRVADLPTLRMEADPDLQLGGRGGQYRITGEVAIPWARVAPNGTILSRISESEDVVITAGALPDSAPQPETKPANLGGRLTVRLGEDVRLDMEQVNTRLSGEVVLRWPQALMPTADGQILVNGEMKVFGPLLHISDGRVRFNGGPVDNPQLSIRAVRDIFGNTQVQTAGVLVSGTARNPDIQAYTDPLTTSERAWGLLITGQDFEYGQGVGAFDIGTYIAPRLYVSYGVSLLDEGNFVSLRYDLKRGFGIKATSSQTDNGVDVSYTRTKGFFLEGLFQEQPEPEKLP